MVILSGEETVTQYTHACVIVRTNESLKKKKKT